MTRAFTLVVLAAAGCHYDRDALYEPTGAAGTVGVAEIPLLPALPDEEVQDACKACAMEKCGEARDNCLEDDACTALLACKGVCDDPACLLDCEAEHGFSAWYEDLWECVLNDSCPDECRSNQNWDCLGNYDWTPAEHPRFAVTFRFENPRTTAWLSSDSRVELGYVGAQARTCAAPDSDCMLGDLLDSDVVDAMESVRLDMELPGFTRIFRGRLEVEDETYGPFGLRERFLGLPLSRTGTVRVFFGPREFLQSSSGGALDLANGAPIQVVVVDCLGAPARGMRFELPELPEAELLYANGFGFAGGPPTDRGFALVTDVPEAARNGPVTVRAIRVDDETTVAEGTAFVRAGWSTHLVLWPRVR